MQIFRPGDRNNKIKNIKNKQTNKTNRLHCLLIPQEHDRIPPLGNSLSHSPSTPHVSMYYFIIIIYTLYYECFILVTFNMYKDYVVIYRWNFLNYFPYISCIYYIYTYSLFCYYFCFYRYFFIFCVYPPFGVGGLGTERRKI